MSRSELMIAEEATSSKARSDTRSLSEPILISLPLPPDKIVWTNKIWSKLLHIAVLPFIVGISILWLEGWFSMQFFKRAWPDMAVLGSGYVGAWLVSSEFERFPFLNQFEAALISVGLTLAPAGLILTDMASSPTRILAITAALGSIGWFLADKFLLRYRNARFVVLPGGIADLLFSAPGISLAKKRGWFNSGPIDGIVADFHDPLSDFGQSLADYSMKGLPTYHAGYIYELLTARVLLGTTSEMNLDIRNKSYYPYVKRTLDLLLIGLSLPFTAPLALLTALAIRLESPGPVLFWQKRLGRKGEPFLMAKFRSMYTGNNGEERHQFAVEDDDRVTYVGRFIRKFRIDELPQFWNVIKGEMSLIGPRPEQVEFAHAFGSDIHLYNYRHLVRPGISGWAQVLHGYAADTEENRRKLEHDLYYVKHQSLFLDLVIVYLTLKTIFTGFGAR